jgi:hypothetical protein
MSVNLGIVQLTEGQASPEVTVNDAFAVFDATLTEIFSADVASGNVSLTNAQFRQMARISIINVGTAGRTVTVPAIKRGFIVTSAASNTDPVSVVRGSTSISLVAGEAKILYTDGTTNGMLAFGLAASSDLPFDLGFFISAKPDPAETVMQYMFDRAVTFPTNLTGSQAKSKTQSAADVSFKIQKNAADIGTIRFNISQTGVYAFAAPISFAVGDFLQIIAPVSQDTTLADISITLKGTRA